MLSASHNTPNVCIYCTNFEITDWLNKFKYSEADRRAETVPVRNTVPKITSGHRSPTISSTKSAEHGIFQILLLSQPKNYIQQAASMHIHSLRARIHSLLLFTLLTQMQSTTDGSSNRTRSLWYHPPFTFSNLSPFQFFKDHGFYDSVFLNLNLICPHCRKVRWIVDIPPQNSHYSFHSQGMHEQLLIILQVWTTPYGIYEIAIRKSNKHSRNRKKIKKIRNKLILIPLHKLYTLYALNGTSFI